MNGTLDLDRLRTFAEVAHTRNFTRAAERLHRVQSAVSGQIKRLEAQMGVRLLERTRRSVKLTKDGEVLLAYAHRMLRLNDAAISDLGRPQPAGLVRLGVSDHSACFMPGALSRFARGHPDVQVEVRCERSWNALDGLDDGELDIAVVTQPCGRSGGEALRSEALVWAAARGSGAPAREPLPLAIFGPGCIYRETVLEALDGVGRAWRMAYNSTSRDGLLIAVRAGLAVTVAPVSTVTGDLEILDGGHRLPALPSMEVSMHLSKRRLSRPARLLADAIRQALRGGGEARL